MITFILNFSLNLFQLIILILNFHLRILNLNHFIYRLSYPIFDWFSVDFLFFLSHGWSILFFAEDLVLLGLKHFNFLSSSNIENVFSLGIFSKQINFFVFLQVSFLNF